ncbi:MAG: ThiF family adenylyltransferase, partial [Gammaproteobacteria bacterium]|nr:ThiF family adenylyltransferase [Gammaproteobacteria bacterium]
QILLPAVGEQGQERLLAARALVVGAGGLGSPVALYLAAAGVGHLTLVDFDQVELSNLQRQIIHQTPDLGRLKVDSARDRLAALNPEVQVTPVARVLEGEELLAAVQAVDVVVDASDNFATRFALNAACVEGRRPLVSGAAVRWEGQVTVFRPDLGDGPCGETLAGRLLLLDALAMEWRTLKLRRDPKCPVCGAAAGPGGGRA